MLSLFKRKPTTLTFRQRVTNFWNWYQDAAESLAKDFSEKQAPSMAPELSRKIDEWLPGFAWEFGPGEGSGHSFTITAEGDRCRQLLALNCVKHAPSLPGWTFYASRQPCQFHGHSLTLDEKKFDPLEFWVVPMVNVESERLDLTIWHPLFAHMDESARWTVLFLYLDMVFGEYGTQSFVGKIEFSDARLSEAIPLTELAEHTAQIASEHGWKLAVPGELFSLFSFENPSSNFPRSDSITWTSCLPPLVESFFENDGVISDPLAGVEAAFAYVSIDTAFFPEGKEAEFRGEIEDALDAALVVGDSGKVVGGGMGLNRTYSDLLLFDGDASLEVVRNTLKKFGVPRGTMIEYFAREHQSRRMAI